MCQIYAWKSPHFASQSRQTETINLISNEPLTQLHQDCTSIWPNAWCVFGTNVVAHVGQARLSVPVIKPRALQHDEFLSPSRDQAMQAMQFRMMQFPCIKLWATQKRELCFFRPQIPLCETTWDTKHICPHHPHAGAWGRKHWVWNSRPW